MDTMRTGAYLAMLRKARGMTQQETAEQLGVSNKTISKWESGGGFPDITVLPALAALPLSIAAIWVGYILVSHPVRYGDVKVDAGLWRNLYRKLLATSVAQWWALLRMLRLGESDMDWETFTVRGQMTIGNRWCSAWACWCCMPCFDGR